MTPPACPLFKKKGGDQETKVEINPESKRFPLLKGYKQQELVSYYFYLNH